MSRHRMPFGEISSIQETAALAASNARDMAALSRTVDHGFYDRSWFEGRASHLQNLSADFYAEARLALIGGAA